MAEELTDVSPMPFGKHKGKPMQDVPASYLFYLWSNGLSQESSSVAMYIRQNLNSLKQEYIDGIW